MSPPGVGVLEKELNTQNPGQLVNWEAERP